MLEDLRLVYVFVYVRALPGAREFYERSLGLRPIEAEEHAVKYDTGDVMLALNVASADMALPAKDSSSILVFHVDDVDAKRAELAAAGVTFDPTERYDIGAIAPFHSPDGHSYMLYEPSREALGWPSGKRVKQIIARPPRVAEAPLLGRNPLLYMFLFVPDFARAKEFYKDKLGLRALEQDDGEGVIKYDVGGVVLATHLTKNVRPGRNLAPVFHVSEIDQAVGTLTERGLEFPGGIRRSEIGAVARFEDPFGHMFYLYEPSDAAKAWPSGKVMASGLRAWSGAAGN